MCRGRRDPQQGAVWGHAGRIGETQESWEPVGTEHSPWLGTGAVTGGDAEVSPVLTSRVQALLAGQVIKYFPFNEEVRVIPPRKGGSFLSKPASLGHQSPASRDPGELPGHSRLPRRPGHQPSPSEPPSQSPTPPLLCGSPLPHCLGHTRPPPLTLLSLEAMPVTRAPGWSCGVRRAAWTVGGVGTAAKSRRRTSNEGGQGLGTCRALTSGRAVCAQVGVHVCA